MTRAQLPNEDDADKTKQQLIDDLQNEITRLRGEKKLLGSIINIAADAIISIDEQQCITHFNEGAEKIFGYSAREIIGAPLEILLPEKFRPKHKKHVQAFDKEQEPSRMMDRRSEIMGLRKNGTAFPARASISRFRQDGVVTLSVYLQDISYVKHAEQLTQKTRDELARVTRVGMLGEISASLAHELNQPLAAILTNTQVLKRRMDAASITLGDSDEIISDVIHDTQRAGEVIRRLRALLKPGEQKVETVDLNQIVTDVDYLLGSEYVIRHTSVTMELTPGLPPVFADRIQLQQVLLNLVANAFDAMEEIDPADRHLLIRTSLPEPTLVEVCVTDSGTGFKEESYQQLLESFYTTKKSGMGMGPPFRTRCCEALEVDYGPRTTRVPVPPSISRCR